MNGILSEAQGSPDGFMLANLLGGLLAAWQRDRQDAALANRVLGARVAWKMCKESATRSVQDQNHKQRGAKSSSKKKRTQSCPGWLPPLPLTLSIMFGMKEIAESLHLLKFPGKTFPSKGPLV